VQKYRLAMCLALMACAGPVMAGQIAAGAPPLGFLESSGPTLGTPLAIPLLALAGGAALVSGIRHIKRKRD